MHHFKGNIPPPQTSPLPFPTLAAVEPLPLLNVSLRACLQIISQLANAF